VRPIIYEARVVAGGNVNTKFEVGRELLLSERNIGALKFATYHEMGHHADFHGIARPAAMRAGGTEDLHALEELAPHLMKAAEQLAGTPLHTGDGRSLRLPSGVAVRCTIEQLRRSPHQIAIASFSMSGHPMGFADAAACALGFLLALKIRPETAAAGHSSYGIFYVGFPRTSTHAGAAHACAGSVHDSASWIEDLRATGRLTRHIEQIPELLLSESTQVRLYAQSKQNVRDALFCSQVNSNALAGTDPRMLHTHALRLAGNETDLATRDAVVASGPLWAAIRCADPVTIRRVLRSDADTLNKGSLRHAGLASLGISCALFRDGTGVFYFGATAANVEEAVGELISAGFSIDEELDDLGSTMLIEAAARNPRWLDQLLGLGADPAHADARGQTALISAAQAGHSDAVAKLLAAGAEADRQDNDGRSALMHAVEYMRTGVVDLLLCKGADPDLITSDGTAAVHYAMNVPTESVRNQIVALLAEAGAAIDEETDDGVTPMAIAAANDFEGTVAQLRMLGAKA
jgi:hypothetical protein